MPFTVRCPSVPCRKFMLVEESDRGQTLPCLICKTPVRVPGVEPPAGLQSTQPFVDLGSETPLVLDPDPPRAAAPLPVARRIPSPEPLR